MSNGKIDFQARHHPSGRYTLMQREGTGMYKDLFSDSDKGAFYQRVTQTLSEVVARGETFKFQDSVG